MHRASADGRMPLTMRARHRGGVALGTAFAAAALLVWASASWACSPAASIGSVSLDSGPPGSQVTVAGINFYQTQLPGFGNPIPVVIHWGDATGQVLARAFGPSFSVNVTIPSAPPGTYGLTAIGLNPDGTVAGTQTSAFRIPGPPSPPSPPAGGSSGGGPGTPVPSGTSGHQGPPGPGPSIPASTGPLTFSSAPPTPVAPAPVLAIPGSDRPEVFAAPSGPSGPAAPLQDTTRPAPPPPLVGSTDPISPPGPHAPSRPAANADSPTASAPLAAAPTAPALDPATTDTPAVAPLPPAWSTTPQARGASLAGPPAPHRRAPGLGLGLDLLALGLVLLFGALMAAELTGRRTSKSRTTD